MLDPAMDLLHEYRGSSTYWLFHDAVLNRLLAQQARDGGWITDYTASGKCVGLANVETTSLAILAIDSVLTTVQGTAGAADQRP